WDRQFAGRLDGDADLVNRQDRVRGDDRSGTEVHPLAGEVRTETAFLALESLDECLQRSSGPVPRVGDGGGLIVTVRRHVVLEQFPQALDDQLARPSVPM